ncbi:hypothetical protein [Aureimonas leprariae]|uniref:Tetratricopeptide repeat protein n=1 Tax=Plantimonas leprariae TaxID=2615207 RepID=A0A7V7TUS7_9HYPH|nr:hypothetical protein [Aureimonas leprariae]KAB0676854.1 hypothetical protein F6X38_19990 [Aureimonas leprariae]
MSGRTLERYGALFAGLPTVAAASLLDPPAGGGAASGLAVSPEALAAARRTVREATGAPAASAADDGDYAAARALDEAGRTGEAAALLDALVGDSASRKVDGCLGLAVLALRAGRLNEAEVLAGRCVELGARHPRACSILGLAALERGDETAAQSYLAAAARIARGEPDFSDDLRGAQRVLLMMRILT